MVNKVWVDFSGCADPQLARLHEPVPQFFRTDGRPHLIANRYMRTASQRLAKKSVATYSELTKEFVGWLESCEIALEDVDEDTFNAYTEVLCFYRKPNGDPLMWSTVNSRSSGAYRLLLWAYDHGHCPDLNPDKSANVLASTRKKYKSRGHPSKPMKKPTSFLLLDAAVRFVESLSLVSANDPFLKRRNKLVGALLLNTGLRISEACDFTLSDLPEINKYGHSTAAKVTGKGNKARLILIPNRLLLKLWQYVDLERERRCESLIDSGRSVANQLFISSRGESLKPNWVQAVFRKAGNLINIKAHPHIMRHTFATYHYLINKDLQALADLLGHESPETTHRFYAHTATLISYAGSYEQLQIDIDNLIAN